LCLSTGKAIEFRPLLPSDEFAFRNFFYSLQAQTVYLRFFYHRKIFSHKTIQEQWANVDYRKNMSIIGLVSKGGHKEIMAIGSYADAEEGWAEVAMVIREDFQGQGLGSHLLGILEGIAVENHCRGFTAVVLEENIAMIRVFKKRYPNCRIIPRDTDVVIEMDFEADTPHATD
jgi:GNAT superfamily N-acetyltransferase